MASISSNLYSNSERLYYLSSGQSSKNNFFRTSPGHYSPKNKINGFTRLGFDCRLQVASKNISDFGRVKFDCRLPERPKYAVMITSIDPVKKGSRPSISALVKTQAETIDGINYLIGKSFSAHSWVTAQKTPEELASLGLTSGLMSMIGVMSVQNGIASAAQAEKINDSYGKTHAQFKIVKGGISTLAGAIFFVADTLSIAALHTASKVAAVTAKVLGKMGVNLFNGSRVLSVVTLGIRLYELGGLNQPLHAILSDKTLSSEERHLKAVAQLKQMVTISEQEKGEIRENLLQQFPELSQAQLNEKAALQEEALLGKKEALITRLLSKEFLQKIRNMDSLNAHEIVEAAKLQAEENADTLKTDLVFASLAVAAMIAGSIFTSTAAVAALTLFGLGTAIRGTVQDVQQLMNDFDKSADGTHDALWLKISNFLAIVTMAILLYFAQGLAVILTAIVVGGIWIGTNMAISQKLS
jgi:hypothetical protein